MRTIRRILAIALTLTGPLLTPAKAADSEVTYLITNGGRPAVSARAELHAAGHHDSPTVSWAGNGNVMRVPEGTYDVLVVFEDGAAKKSLWFDAQAFSGKVQKTVEIGLPVAEVTFIITSGGVEAKDHARVELHAAGQHGGPTVAWAGTGRPMRVPEGAYDALITFEDGAARKTLWLDNQTLAGTVTKTVEAGVPVAEVTFIITAGGVEAKGHSRVELHAAGQHGGPTVAWAGTGRPMRVPEGAYDALITFEDGAARKTLWLDNQTLAGTITKTVEAGVPVADVTYIITNGGVEAKGHSRAELHPAGQHTGPTIAWAGTGNPMRVPEGTYDVAVTFEDGSARRALWIDNQTFTGKVEKTVEVGAVIADVRYIITNNGQDAGDKARVQFDPVAARKSGALTWSRSGGTSRLPADSYDVEIIFTDGLIHKDFWIDNQPFAGKVEKTVELGIVIAEPVVTVTQDGVDAGDKAAVVYMDAARHQDQGSVRSGETAIVEAGTYDIHAILFGAEGWLRGMAIAGKPRLTIALKAQKIDALKIGGPLPKSCKIEVYGVNFDFDKAVLRPDSEPMLKQVLALFKTTPDFSAEVGGHTDNVGTPAYNLKLSDARAAAVRDWLLKHGLTANRVTFRGYGDTRPLLPNTTDDNRFKNRRVELQRANCQ